MERPITITLDPSFKNEMQLSEAVLAKAIDECDAGEKPVLELSAARAVVALLRKLLAAAAICGDL